MHTDPVSGYQSYDRPAATLARSPRDPATARGAALAICTIADVAAGLLALWIVLHVLDANQGNAFVESVRGSADLLGGWAQDLFTMDTDGIRALPDHGLLAALYLLLGHGIAARCNRA